MILLLLLACGASQPPPRVATPPSPIAPTAIALARTTDGLVLDLPPSSGERTEGSFAALGAVTPAPNQGTTKVWRVPLPVHSNLFVDRQAGARSFGNWEPRELEIRLDGRRLKFKRFAAAPYTYGYDRKFLLVGLPAGAAPPTAEKVQITWPRAIEAERTYHLEASGRTPEDFALRTVIIDKVSHHGALLPAPASATWTLTVPESGVFASRVTILPPTIRSTSGDGATLHVEVVDGDAPTSVLSKKVPPLRWVDLRADLAAWAGQSIQLRIRTTPGNTPTNDLVFLEEPTVYTPSEDPKRIVVAFIDTVRADHLGMYGYSRDTTPKLDRWARNALRLDANRTVAPWTLPSARATLTGAQPEMYFEHDSLPARLAEAGFYTDGIVGNAYLSHTFEMHRGFGRYRYEHLISAAKVVDHAEKVFERWPDRDVMLWVQFMDAHLPYMEPPAYRTLFAGAKPDSLSSVSRVELVKLGPDSPHFDEVRDYVVARYDQNLRVLDDQLSRLFSTAGDDATTVVFADHGEEFWDHGDFEHGHSFFDELLRVPMLISDPHMAPGALSQPTSLMDLTPTVLELNGLPHEVPHGQSLVGAAFDQDGARDALTTRNHAFGRPLYGDDGWGVLHDGTKWSERGGRSEAYDLAADPGENSPVDSTDVEVMTTAMAEALDRPVLRAWRVVLGRDVPRGATLTVEHPKGIAEVVCAYDPRGNHDRTTFEVKDGVGIVTAPARRSMPDSLYIIPNDSTPAGLKLTLSAPGSSANMVAKPDGEAIIEHRSPTVTVTPMWLPKPVGQAVSAYHPEMAQQLEELGYLDKE